MHRQRQQQQQHRRSFCSYFRLAVCVFFIHIGSQLETHSHKHSHTHIHSASAHWDWYFMGLRWKFSVKICNTAEDSLKNPQKKKTKVGQEYWDEGAVGGETDLSDWIWICRPKWGNLNRNLKSLWDCALLCVRGRRRRCGGQTGFQCCCWVVFVCS